MAPTHGACRSTGPGPLLDLLLAVLLLLLLLLLLW
jgi:hypothetical protein